MPRTGNASARPLRGSSAAKPFGADLPPTWENEPSAKTARAVATTCWALSSWLLVPGRGFQPVALPVFASTAARLKRCAALPIRSK
jgi:hypothetical protein